MWAEEILQQSFRLLVEGVADYAIFILDPDGRVVSWNRGAEHITGYTYDEVIGQPMSTFFTPEDRSIGVPQHELHVAAAEGHFEAEGWRVRKDGSRFWANAILTAMYDEEASGRLIGFSNITRDLTERRRADQALRDSEEHLRNIIESAVDAIVTIDEAGIIHSVNPATERIFGHRAADMIGQNVSLLMPPPYRDEHQAYLREYLRGGRARIIGVGRQVVGRRADGSTFAMHLAVSEFRAGGRRMFTGIVHDLSMLHLPSDAPADQAAGLRLRHQPS